MICWLLILLLLATPARAAWVQGKLGAIGASGSTTAATVSFTATVGAGNTVVGAIFAGLTNFGTVTFTITDDKSNTYIPVAPRVVPSGAPGMQMFALYNIRNAPQTITITPSVAVDFLQGVADEYSGTLVIDAATAQSLVGPGTLPNVITSGTVTTKQPSDIVWGIQGNQNGVLTPAVGTGFTQRTKSVSSGSDWGEFSEDLTLTTPGATAATYTDTTNSNASFLYYTIGVITLRPFCQRGALMGVGC